MPSSVRARLSTSLLVLLAVGPGSLAAAVPGQDDKSGAAQTHNEQPTAAPPNFEYPFLKLTGFADVNFAAQDASEGPRGFTEGQFVLHLASALSPRVNFFGELSFTPRADAGTGNPAATGFNAEVERAII